jgi:hypothetical protein
LLHTESCVLYIIGIPTCYYSLPTRTQRHVSRHTTHGVRGLRGLQYSVLLVYARHTREARRRRSRREETRHRHIDINKVKSDTVHTQSTVYHHAAKRNPDFGTLDVLLIQSVGDAVPHTVLYCISYEYFMTHVRATVRRSAGPACRDPPSTMRLARSISESEVSGIGIN